MEGKAPEFELLNQDGVKVRLEDLRGKVVVMTYMYTSCTYACPLLLTKFMKIEDRFREYMGEELILVAITVDPERDTPEVLHDFASNLGSGPSGWVFLTGTRQEIDRVLEAYNIRYLKDEKTKEYSHTNRIVIIDREGNLVYRLNGLHYPVDVLLEKVEEVLKG